MLQKMLRYNENLCGDFKFRRNTVVFYKVYIVRYHRLFLCFEQRKTLA